MNHLMKLEDKRVVTAWQNGYNDFLDWGESAPCPYELTTKEAAFWVMGFTDAQKEVNKS